jgi:hypothetical protein
MEINRMRLKAMTRGAYDLQKLRIQTGLRLCANFKSKLGNIAGETEDELEENAQKVLTLLKASFKRLTDGVAKNRTLPIRQKFQGDELISEYSEIMLVNQYLELERVERQQFAQLENILLEFPIYTQFLINIAGVGPAMAAVCISEIDIAKAKYPSSLWMYAGLDVATNGAGRSRKKEHLIEREYTDKNGEQQTRLGITFNPFLKTKLVGVLSGCFMRCKSPYSDVYKNYKFRLQSDPSKVEWSKLHIHNASIRYMIKIFLIDLHINWRKIEGLEVSTSYHEGKLRHKHTVAKTKQKTIGDERASND